MKRTRRHSFLLETSQDALAPGQRRVQLEVLLNVLPMPLDLGNQVGVAIGVPAPCRHHLDG